MAHEIARSISVWENHRRNPEDVSHNMRLKQMVDHLHSKNIPLDYVLDVNPNAPIVVLCPHMHYSVSTFTYRLIQDFYKIHKRKKSAGMSALQENNLLFTKAISALGTEKPIFIEASPDSNSRTIKNSFSHIHESWGTLHNEFYGIDPSANGASAVYKWHPDYLDSRLGMENIFIADNIADRLHFSDTKEAVVVLGTLHEHGKEGRPDAMSLSSLLAEEGINVLVLQDKTHTKMNDYLLEDTFFTSLEQIALLRTKNTFKSSEKQNPFVSLQLSDFKTDTEKNAFLRYLQRFNLDWEGYKALILYLEEKFVALETDR
jgi:hypothetical protein